MLSWVLAALLLAPPQTPTSEVAAAPRSKKEIYLAEKVEAALRSPSLYDEALKLLGRRGFDIPTEVLERDTSQPHEANEGVLDALERLYRESETYYPQFLIAEDLLEFEEKFQIWRFHHVKMVERTIGRKPGT